MYKDIAPVPFKYLPSGIQAKRGRLPSVGYTRFHIVALEVAGD